MSNELQKCTSSCGKVCGTETQYKCTYTYSIEYCLFITQKHGSGTDFLIRCNKFNVVKICFPAMMIFSLSQTFSTAVPNTRLTQFQHTSWWNNVFYCWLVFLDLGYADLQFLFKCLHLPRFQKLTMKFTHCIQFHKSNGVHDNRKYLSTTTHDLMTKYISWGRLSLPSRQFLVRLCYYNCKKLKI
jgi:hypothetical protein